MRTTLTLEDDVAAMLERVQRERKSSLKEVVNTALRQGLSAMQARPKHNTRFRTQPIHLGKCYLPNLDNIAEVLAIAEGEDHK
ncbi:MAG: hypothetical protein JO307_14945 [Bryobacterales bacterium]|nr:hypothetical protein [Bryobacterales bacterium]MBV9398089.1 hypothetical protein [Bryobacterales bacterium]